MLRSALTRLGTELQEVNFVLWTTHPKEGKEACRGDRITKSEIATALDIWRSWEQTLPEV